MPILKVGIRSYSVEYWSAARIKQETDHDNVCGFTDHYQSKIIINQELSKDAQQEALMHELLHCLLDNSGIEEISRQVKEGANLSELVATILAPRLHAVLLENDLKTVISQ